MHTMAASPGHFLSLQASGAGALRTEPGRRAPRILVVDAESIVAEMVAMALRHEGADATTAWDARTALAAARNDRPDLVVLATRLPDMDGAMLLNQLLRCHPHVTALHLFERQSTSAATAELGKGSNWLAKPFSLEDLLTRVRRLLSSTPIGADLVPATNTLGDLEFDADARQVRRGGDVLALPSKEYQLLHFLLRNAHQVVTPQQILGWVWRYDHSGGIPVVRHYVSRLRRRIDADRLPLLHTVRQSGYVLTTTTGLLGLMAVARTEQRHSRTPTDTHTHGVQWIS
jgi:two-component system, OmpR family, response regulator